MEEQAREAEEAAVDGDAAQHRQGLEGQLRVEEEDQASDMDPEQDTRGEARRGHVERAGPAPPRSLLLRQ